MMQKEYFQPLPGMIVDFVDSENHKISIRMHYHDGYEILFFEKGCAQFIAGTDLYTVTAGDIVFTRPYTMHTAYRLEQGQYRRYYINIVSGVLEQYAKQLGIEDILESLNERQFFKLGTGTDTQLFRRMQMHFSNIYRQSEKHSWHWKEVIEAELLLLLSDIYEGMADLSHGGPEQSLSRGGSHMRKIFDYIDRHLFDDIALDDLKKTFYLSTYYICRLFKQHTGLTLSWYINRKRIMIAQQILSGPEATITEACYATGYKNMQYFCKVFREISGLTPSQYMRNVRNLPPGQPGISDRMNDRHDTI